MWLIRFCTYEIYISCTSLYDIQKNTKFVKYLIKKSPDWSCRSSLCRKSKIKRQHIHNSINSKGTVPQVAAMHQYQNISMEQFMKLMKRGNTINILSCLSCIDIK